MINFYEYLSYYYNIYLHNEYKKKLINYLPRRKSQTKRKKTKHRTRHLGHKRRNLGGSFWSIYGRNNRSVMYHAYK